MKKTSILLLAYLLLQNPLFGQQVESDLSWPKEIDAKKGTVTLYQPQLENYSNNIIEGRMAVSIKPPESDMIFGALWFNARMSTDMDARTATLERSASLILTSRSSRVLRAIRGRASLVAEQFSAPKASSA